MGKKSPSFESALKRLEAIVGELEKPDVTLDKTLRLFEEGQELSRVCQRQLTAVEQRVSLLMEKGDGELELEEFEAEGAEEEE